MKKELAALALLLTVLSADIWNTRRLCVLLEELQTRSDSVLSFAETGQWEAAAATSDELALFWQDAEGYTQVFLRHPDIDAVSDALTALQSAVRTRDADACFSSAQSVSTRLTGIRETETPSLGSIF